MSYFNVEPAIKAYLLIFLMEYDTQFKKRKKYDTLWE